MTDGVTGLGSIHEPQGGPYEGPSTFAGGSLSQGCTCKGAATSGEPGIKRPINTATGDFYESTTDLTVPGPGLPLTFTRTYDADSAQAGNSEGLGVGWSDNLNMSLSPATNGDPETVTEENGAQIVFNPTSGDSDAWCSASYNYCPASPSTIATLNYNGGSNPWTFTRDLSGQQTFQFSGSGVLTEIEDTSGGSASDTLTATSESGGTGHCPSGTYTCTQWTASSTGATLTLQYSASELIAVYSYTSAGVSEETSTFCYIGQSCATGAVGNTGELYSVTDPGGLITTYSYDSANTATTGCTPSGTSCYENDVLTVSGPAPGAVLTNCYYGDSPCGSGSGGSQGQIFSQTDPTGQVTELVYAGNPAGSTPATTTVTTYPEGTGGSSNQVVYSYEYGELIGETSGTGSSTDAQYFVPDQVSGLSTEIADGNAINLTTNAFDSYGTSGSYLTDADDLTTTDGALNTATSAYTSLNEPYCQIDPADGANGVTCPSMTTIASGSSGASLPQSTIDVASTTGFSSTPHLAVPTPAGLQAVVCTGDTSTTFTGCSGGSGTMATGQTVLQSAAAPTRGSDPWPGAAVTFYDAAGYPVDSVTAVGGVTQTAYTAATGSVPELAYCTVDAVDYAASVTCPSTPPTTPPTSATDYTTTIYNSAGNVTSSTTPIDGTTTYSYGDSQFPSLATSVTDPDGTVTTNTYDSAGRLTESVQSFGLYSSTSITAYDSAGNVYCTIAPIAYANGDTTCPVVTTVGSSSSGASLPQSTINVGSTSWLLHRVVPGRSEHRRHRTGDVHGGDRRHLHRVQRGDGDDLGGADGPAVDHLPRSGI